MPGIATAWSDDSPPTADAITARGSLVAPPARTALVVHRQLSDMLLNRGRKEDVNGYPDRACKLYVRALDLDMAFGPSSEAAYVQGRCV